MATDKHGKPIKGTKKARPPEWATNEYVAGLYEHLEAIDFKGGFLRYQAPKYTSITARFDFLDRTDDAFVYNDAKVQ